MTNNTSPAPRDRADEIVDLISALVGGKADRRPAKWRAGPRGTGSGSLLATKAEALAVARAENARIEALIAAGAMTPVARSRRWIVEPFTPRSAR